MDLVNEFGVYLTGRIGGMVRREILRPAGSGPDVEARRVWAEPEISLPAGEAGFQGRPEPLSDF